MRRARPVVAMAAIAFALGAIVGANHHSSSARSLASQFVAAWERGDYATMYSEIDPTVQRRLTASEFASAYREAEMTATAVRRRRAGSPHELGGGLVAVAVRLRTRLFGTIAANFTLPIAGTGEDARIAWTPALAFPGLRPGERLTRQTRLPARAALLARDGSTLASGAAQTVGERASPLGAAASAVLGSVGPIPSARLRTLEAQGVPADAIVGVSGLERAFDERLRGTPGGELLAGERVLASAASRPGAAVRTTVSPALQREAVTALGGQFGGVVVLRPSSGEILAVAGIGLNDVQPPGSTFKMVTLTAALEAGVAHTSSSYPYATYATLDGVKLHNAGGESCGGSLALAFAVSCNSVFAPLGVKVGAARLVATAEGFGFNHDPGIAGASESTLPAAARIQGELDVGSTAIGQGEVQASALQMARVAATIADRGRRPTPTFTPAANTASAAAHGATAGPRVMSAATARTVRRLMIGVVREGTGHSAAIPGVVVAGKTGTAELGSPSSCSSASSSESGSGEPREEASSGECDGTQSDPHNTDAWFAAFAPALHPKLVVGVLLVRDGAGGDTAAPIARELLEAGLRSAG